MVASVEVEQSSSQWAGQCNGGGPVSTAVNVRLRLLCISWTCALPAIVRRVVGRQKNSQYSRRLSQQAESPSSELPVPERLLRSHQREVQYTRTTTTTTTTTTTGTSDEIISTKNFV